MCAYLSNLYDKIIMPQCLEKSVPVWKKKDEASFNTF